MIHEVDVGFDLMYVQDVFITISHQSHALTNLWMVNPSNEWSNMETPSKCVEATRNECGVGFVKGQKRLHLNGGSHRWHPRRKWTTEPSGREAHVTETSEHDGAELVDGGMPPKAGPAGAAMGTFLTKLFLPQ